MLEGKNIAYPVSIRRRQTRYPRLCWLMNCSVSRLTCFSPSSTDEALAAKNATRTIPIVFYGVSDPVASGLVDSLARPGGNITGSHHLTAVLAGKRLELLKETVPKLSRGCGAVGSEKIKVLINHGMIAKLPRTREIHWSFKSMGRKTGPTSSRVRSKRQLRLVAPLSSTTSSSFINTYRKQIADLSDKESSAGDILSGRFLSPAGGLMSYGPDSVRTINRRAAVFVDKILKGGQAHRPASRAADQVRVGDQSQDRQGSLALTIPPVVMMRAEQVDS